MLKRDYNAIAKAIAEAHTPGGLLNTHYLIAELSAYFAHHNPAFRPERFREACRGNVVD